MHDHPASEPEALREVRGRSSVLNRNPVLLGAPGTRRLRWVTFASGDFPGLG